MAVLRTIQRVSFTFAVQLNDAVLKKIFLFLYSGSVHEAYLNAQCTFCRTLSVDEVLMKCLGSVSVLSMHFLRSL